MKLFRRIMSILGVIILVGMYASTLFFALSGKDGSKNMLAASIILTIIIPVILYSIILVTRLLENKDEDKEEL